MIVVFFKHGVGAAAGPINYLLAEETLLYSQDGSVARNPDNEPILQARESSPEILRGDPEVTGKIIDSLSTKYKYTSGVLAFTREDTKKLTPEIENEIMDNFEKTAFAGLSKDRYDITFIKHQQNGKTELHFITPRVELQTSKSLNIRPPGKGSEYKYDQFRDAINYTYAMDDPDEHNRQRDNKNKQPNYEKKIYKNITPLAGGGKAVADQLTADINVSIQVGQIKNHKDVMAYLKKLEKTGELKITRRGDKYVSVKPSGAKKAVRLRGAAFQKGFKAGSQFTTTKNSRRLEFLNANILTRSIKTKIIAGDIKDYSDVVKTIKEKGLEITRSGDKYMGVKEKGRKAFRCKDKIFHRGWSQANHPVKEAELLAPRELRKKTPKDISLKLRAQIEKDAKRNISLYEKNRQRVVMPTTATAINALKIAETLCNALCADKQQLAPRTQKPKRDWLDPAEMDRIWQMKKAKTKRDDDEHSSKIDVSVNLQHKTPRALKPKMM